MGLDQYLFRRTKNDTVEEMYWRKANFVHEFFTKDWMERGFADDNCTEFPVTKEDLIKLRTLCDEVLANKNDAPWLLPTTSGFFFGSTAYDDWYYEDVKDTRDVVDRILNDFEEGDDFYYYAWY